MDYFRSKKYTRLVRHAGVFRGGKNKRQNYNIDANGIGLSSRRCSVQQQRQRKTMRASSSGGYNRRQTAAAVEFGLFLVLFCSLRDRCRKSKPSLPALVKMTFFFSSFVYLNIYKIDNGFFLDSAVRLLGFVCAAHVRRRLTFICSSTSDSLSV